MSLDCAHQCARLYCAHEKAFRDLGSGFVVVQCWICWRNEFMEKDYNAIAEYFCPVFKVNGLSGTTVSIKKSGIYNTLGRGYCR